MDEPMKWKRDLLVGGVLLFVILGLGLWISTTSFYTWAARKTVTGEVVSIANLTPDALLRSRPGGAGGGITYSFAIVIKASDGTIYSASSEDRQWAAVKEGYRVRATLFPYSPLSWTKQGTYHGARLRKVLAVAPTTGAGSAPSRAPTTTDSPSSRQ
jgi:hypothetical protein